MQDNRKSAGGKPPSPWRSDLAKANRAAAELRVADPKRSDTSGVEFLPREDEELLWKGRPRQGLVLRLGWPTVLYGAFLILWALSYLWQMPLGTNLPSPSRFPQPPWFFGLLILFVGVSAIFGELIIDAWSRRRLIYAVTSKRAVIHDRRGQTYSIPLQLARDSVLVESGTRGTIVFRPTEATVRWWELGRFNLNSFHPAMERNTTLFFEIEDADRVYSLLQDTEAKA